MTIMKTVLVAAGLTFLSCNVNASADKAIAEAEAAQKAAAKVGYEWRDTGKLIKQAKKLSAEGDSEKAIKLAKQAEQQGQDALAQYHSESKRYDSNH